MAIGIYKLPVCDSCGLPWLPTKWTPDSDPRDPAKTLRCGKCKSSGWDREHNAEVRKEENVPRETFVEQPTVPDEVFEMANTIQEHAEDISGGARRCRHRMTNCPICNPPEAA
jgi:hypothetical protein